MLVFGGADSSLVFLRIWYCNADKAAGDGSSIGPTSEPTWPLTAVSEGSQAA